MSVNLYPQSIKPVVDLEDGVTVYVPGYAYIGPEEPTLCSSVSEFEGLYGTTPYLFEADQSTSQISKGSPEKGYLYAKSLLESGLKVLFHRFKTTGVKTAQASYSLKYWLDGAENYTEMYLVTQAISFGRAYANSLVKMESLGGSLFRVTVKDSGGNIVSNEVISFDPSNPLYLRLGTYGLIQFKTTKSTTDTAVVEFTDSIMAQIAKLAFEEAEQPSKAGQFTLTPSTPVTETVDNTTKVIEGTVKLTVEEGGPAYEFYLDDVAGSKSTDSIKGMLSSLAGDLMNPLKDFERYPSIAYLTSGGYYLNSYQTTAEKLMAYAVTLSAVAMVDLDISIKDQTSWGTDKAAYAGLSGSKLSKARSASFAGCNSFSLTPYRVILGDSFNYLKSLGENMKSGIKPWIPVANDPNGVSPLGYDTTQKISTDLAETMAEGKIGVSVNPLIYSKAAGGYKIMGNRTLYPNDGVLEPNSFLNIAVIVTRVERAARQIANKLKIVSTNPDDTFLKFKQSVAKTIDPMVVNQDGVISYRIKHLPKDKPATINIQIHLVVLEGIETFNIYIPYELQLD